MKSLFRKTNLLVSKNIFRSLAIRPFSNNSKDSLISCLNDEIDYEEKEYKPIMKEELDAFSQKTGFEIVDRPNSARLELKKKASGFDITISYNARTPPPQEEDNQEEAMQDNILDFQVCIQKEGKNSGFFVDAMVVDGNIQVHAVNTVDNIQEYYNNFMNGKVDPDMYQGPDYFTLDEKLQTSFDNFLKTLGINEEVAALIDVYSQDKDQRLYMKWLSECKNNLL